MPSQGNTNSRGYGSKHQRLRKQIEPIVGAGKADCWRCGQPITPDESWDLGHDDDDRTRYRGPEHTRCNRATNGRQQRTHAVDTSRPW